MCSKSQVCLPEKHVCDGKRECPLGEDEMNCCKYSYSNSIPYPLPNTHAKDILLENVDQKVAITDEKMIHNLMVSDALSNGQEMEFDLDERPLVNLEGYLTKKHFNNEWHVLCYDELSTEEQEQAATHICRYLGFR